MSEETSTSTSTLAVTSQEASLRQEAEMTAGSVTQAFHFSSGNPRIEETRGIMHLLRDDITSSSSDLPVERKPLLCVLGVPNHMTYADFCQFCGSFIHHILEMRVVRNDGMEDRYSVMIRFDTQIFADNFYKHFRGKQFSSLEVEACLVLFTSDVKYTGSIEHAQTSPVNSMEQPSCAVCLERLDQETGGILTTICNHSFHCSCISKWSDSSCPVCRYCQQQSEKSICSVCGTAENLWMCLICGFIGCGKYKEGHAIEHWKETQHCYSVELETQRVWDHAGDNYVHRLIQSKTDGKLVELNRHCPLGDDDCGNREYGVDSGFTEALLNSKIEAIVNEYNELLSAQLENQKMYFEALLQDVEEETKRETSEAINRAFIQNPKLQKLQAKLDKYVIEKKFLEDIHDNLSKNQAIWEAKIAQIQEREKHEKQVLKQDTKIQELEEQLRSVMQCLETGDSYGSQPISDESVGIRLSLSAESSRKSCN